VALLIDYATRPASAYAQALAALLPRGLVWRVEPGGRIAEMLEALGEELSRAHALVYSLHEEIDPRAASTTLGAWLEALALPRRCSPLPNSPAEIRQLAHAAYVASGGNTPAYFIGLASAAGMDAEISEEIGPFRVGDRVGGRLYGARWVHVWIVHLPTGLGATRRAQQLECIISEGAPLHTRVFFAYDLEA
jgi:uncharacterized protein YmfQ (DUF2313 family)